MEVRTEQPLILYSSKNFEADSSSPYSFFDKSCAPEIPDTLLPSEKPAKSSRVNPTKSVKSTKGFSSKKNSASATSGPVNPGSPICASVGYDRGRPEAFFYKKKKGTYNSCKELCEENGCLSFAIGENSCILYGADLAKNFKADSSSPFTFWDASCGTEPTSRHSSTRPKSTPVATPTSSKTRTQNPHVSSRAPSRTRADVTSSGLTTSSVSTVTDLTTISSTSVSSATPSPSAIPPDHGFCPIDPLYGSRNDDDYFYTRELTLLPECENDKGIIVYMNSSTLASGVGGPHLSAPGRHGVETAPIVGSWTANSTADFATVSYTLPVGYTFKEVHIDVSCVFLGCDTSLWLYSKTDFDITTPSTYFITTLDQAVNCDNEGLLTQLSIKALVVKAVDPELMICPPSDVLAPPRSG